MKKERNSFYTTIYDVVGLGNIDKIKKYFWPNTSDNNLGMTFGTYQIPDYQIHKRIVASDPQSKNHICSTLSLHEAILLLMKHGLSP